MTIEEGRELFARSGIDYAIHGLEAYLMGQPEIAAVLAIVPALELLKRQKQYEWHNLRKNPEDLPKLNGRSYRPCLVVIHYDRMPVYAEYEIFEGYGPGFYGFSLDQIIAWRYIEPFEEDEDVSND